LELKAVLKPFPLNWDEQRRLPASSKMCDGYRTKTQPAYLVTHNNGQSITRGAVAFGYPRVRLF
jgi:hypothetical protein